MPVGPTCLLLGNGVHVHRRLLDDVLSFIGLCLPNADHSLDMLHVLDMSRSRIAYFQSFLSFFPAPRPLHIGVKKRKGRGMVRGSFCQRPSSTSATFNTHTLLFFNNRTEKRHEETSEGCFGGCQYDSLAVFLPLPPFLSLCITPLLAIVTTIRDSISFSPPPFLPILQFKRKINSCHSSNCSFSSQTIAYRPIHGRD